MNVTGQQSVVLQMIQYITGKEIIQIEDKNNWKKIERQIPEPEFRQTISIFQKIKSLTRKYPSGRGGKKRKN